MPKRWLSRRGRLRHNDSSTQATPSNDDQNFDFAFVDPSTGGRTAIPFITALPVTSTQDERPTTAGGVVEGRPRKNLKIDVPIIRPRSSEGHRTSTYNPAHRASRSVDDFIGLAFGSPSHPPMAFCNLAVPLSPTRADPAPRFRGPFASNGRIPHLQPKGWKKIGALFRGRAAFTKGKDSPFSANPPQAQVEVSDESQDLHSKDLDTQAKASFPNEPTRQPPPIPPEPEHKHDMTKPYPGRSMLLETIPPSSAETLGPPRKLTERPVRMSSLPKLEVETSGRALDCYTVKMSNLAAASRSSSLLARRGKGLDNLSGSTSTSRNTSSSDSEHCILEESPALEAGGELLLPRRMTSPTMPKAPFAISKSEASPKYSLFPPKAPAPIKIVGRVPFESTLRRSATSPARLSPMQERFPSSKAKPMASDRKISEEKPLSSPDEKTASTDRTDPWSSNHSLQSSVSSSTTIEDIFFDIKSFRDSKGIEDAQQFVINRPDSAVVQIARSRSKVNATSRSHKQTGEAVQEGAKPTLSSLRNEFVDKHASINTVNTAVFDEVIAAVEQFTTPTSAKHLQNAATTEDVSSTSTSEKIATSKADLNMKLLPPDPVLPMRVASMSRRDQMSRNIPSPVPEEVSPLSKKSLFPDKGLNLRSASPASTITDKPKDSTYSLKREDALTSSMSSQAPGSFSKSKDPSKHEDFPTPAHDAGLASLKRVDTPIGDSPTIPQSPPPRKPVPNARDDDRPPPVPEKDAKFIPISKFAAKNTVSKVEKVGIRPARPMRSATDTIVTSSPRLNQHKQYSPGLGVRTERSATLPIPQAQQQHRTSPLSASSEFAPRTSVAESGNSEALGVKAIVRAAPTAEVSVARTVSLSRKQSARVLVPGPKLAARRAAERNKENDGTDSGTDTPNTVLSAANSPAIGTDSPKMQQEQIKPHLVDVRPTEVTVRPNPLRSNPSPPSVVITGLPAVVSSAGTATPATRAISKAPTRPIPDDPDKERAREKIKALKEKAKEKIANDAELEQRRTDSPVQIRVASPETVIRDKEKERQIIEKYKESDKTKWEISEMKCLSPVMNEGERRYGHKQGLSVGVVLESA